MKIQEHTYTNPEYYSKVNDFGDEYHTEETDDRDELLMEVRKLKRKYRDFGEWCDAMSIYTEYCERLLEKYGGKKRFRALYQIGLVKEYVPFCPELRKIRKNRKYIKEGMPREAATTMNFHCNPDPFPIPKDVEVQFSFKVPKGQRVELNNIHEFNMTAKISNELSLIDEFYRGTAKPMRMSKKQQRKRILHKMYKEDPDMDRSFTKRYKEYQEKKMLEEYVEDEEPANTVHYYKGISLTREQEEEIEVIDYLDSIGVQVNERHMSKSSRKIIRKRDFNTTKKKKKKGKHKKRPSYMKKFASGEYKTFADFEKEMTELTGAQLARMSKYE